MTIDRLHLPPDEVVKRVKACTFEPLFTFYHWQTFLCSECKRYAMQHLVVERFINPKRCVNCIVALPLETADGDAPPLAGPARQAITQHEICFVCDSRSGKPRSIALCDVCETECADQLSHNKLVAVVV
jgi:hypothetical protein